jgi:CrcB protein
MQRIKERRMNILLLRYFAIGAAGFVGTIARFAIGSLFGRLNFRFPIGTLFINVTGSLFLGWFLTFIASRNVSDTTRLAIAVGFVGGYTTFSTFMYESNKLAQDDGAVFQAILNLVGSLILGLLGVRLGILLAKWL